MDRVFSRWMSELTLKKGVVANKQAGKGAVKAVARAYEAARNALEYRAEHLVRRAAIERILKRELVLAVEPDTMADHLDQELSWADYTGESEEQQRLRNLIVSTIRKYQFFISDSGLSREWLTGVLSAEIENLLNPNPDYNHFSKLGYAYMRRKFNLNNIDVDLPLAIAIERVMNQSDDQGVSFRLFLLIQSQSHEDPMEAIKKAYEIYLQSKNSKLTAKLSNIVKKNVGPVILLRDMYFTNPEEFVLALAEKEGFDKMAGLVFNEQVYRMKGRIATATVRSLIYIFLTKMLFILILEVPISKFTRDGVDWMAMGINLALPLALMWFLAGTIRLPGKYDKEKLLKESWQISRELSSATVDEIKLTFKRSKMGEIVTRVFYVLYAVFFMAIFFLILWLLRLVHFGIIDMLIFLFFTSVVSFFAYRIRQSLILYKVSSGRNREENLVDMMLLPLVVAGSAVSKEVARLNFLIFIFDFILEAPLKSILRFVDGWFEFLSIKKEEVIE